VGLGPLSGVSIGRLSKVGALWDCVTHVCGGEGGCAGSGVPLSVVLALSWYGEVSLGGILIITSGVAQRACVRVYARALVSPNI